MNSHEQLRKDLLSSMGLMFSGSTNPLLLDALVGLFPRLSFALVVNWIPEQAEDIYWVLIDLERIAVVEVPRPSDSLENVAIEVVGLKTYMRRRLSAEAKRKLEVAVELMKESLSK